MAIVPVGDNTMDKQKELKKKMQVYRRCAAGKPVDCSKCIGCSSKGV